MGGRQAGGREGGRGGTVRNKSLIEREHVETGSGRGLFVRAVSNSWTIRKERSR